MPGRPNSGSEPRKSAKTGLFSSCRWAIRKQPAAPDTAAIAAATVATAVTGLYAYVIARQPGDDGLRPWLIGASLLVGASVLLASTLVAKMRARLLLLSLGAFIVLIWMVVGAFSIGVLLLPAALLALFAASRTASLLPTVEAWAIVIIAAAASLALMLVLES
jgi:hypothetical protein